MQNQILRLLAISGICSMAASAASVGLSSAATKQAKGSASVIIEHKAYKKDGTAVVAARQERPLSKQRKQPQAESKSGNHPNRYHVTLGKKVLPKAIIRPQSHGVLEDPQRYDPRLHHRTGRVQDPQAPELVPDHFLELDRNQDGKIDPIERAFGRLDMDRDLQKRQP